MRTNEAQAQVNIYSYGRKTAHPPAAKYVLDVRNFRDPVGNMSIRKTCESGIATAAQEFVAEDDRIPILIEEFIGLCFAHLKMGRETYVSIAFVDHHGRWVAPAVAEIVAAGIERAGYSISVRHQGLIQQPSK